MEAAPKIEPTPSGDSIKQYAQELIEMNEENLRSLREHYGVSVLSKCATSAYVPLKSPRDRLDLLIQDLVDVMHKIERYHL